MLLYTHKDSSILKRNNAKLDQLEAIEIMRRELKNLGNPPSDETVYEYAVNFFNIITPFQDRIFSIDAKLFDKASTDDIVAANKRIGQLGRNGWGFVPLKRGKAITLDNLVLGGVFYLSKNSARYWKEKCKSSDTQYLIRGQIEGLVNLIRDPMIDSLSKIIAQNNTEQTDEKRVIIFFLQEIEQYLQQRLNRSYTIMSGHDKNMTTHTLGVLSQVQQSLLLHKDIKHQDLVLSPCAFRKEKTLVVDELKYSVAVDLLKQIAEYTQNYSDKTQCWQKIVELKKRWKYLCSSSVWDKFVNVLTPLNSFAQNNVKVK